MNVIEKDIRELREYELNPRKNEEAVTAVANSIREFGFKVPIIIDKDDVIVAGHTRLKAAKMLEMNYVPCIVADDLTDEQVKAFRLADNKVAELAGWNFDLLESELAELGNIDMSQFGFDLTQFEENNDFFARELIDGNKKQEGNEEYNSFLEKFEIKKTTDDCYTPPKIYDAIADWVAEEYGVKKKDFVRPFYPNGDYQKENYDGKIVVDNPPFSILSEILRFYMEHGVRFFLFAPTLTLFSSASQLCTAIPVYGKITYENGAVVNTSFLTNLDDDDVRVRTSPELYKRIKEAEELSNTSKEKPLYDYPDEVLLSPMVAQWSRYGIEFKVSKSESIRVSSLDAQSESGIFGGGYLLSERAAAERAAAERRNAQRFELSEREREIVRQLGEACS